jgi:hypothetical protein
VIDTGEAQQNGLWARYLNYKTGFSFNANVYAAALLSCSVDSGTANLVLTNRTSQPPIGGTTPMLYTATSTVSFDAGYASNTGDEFETQLGSFSSGGVTALCSLSPPVTYLAPPDTTVDGCQSVEQQAAYFAQMLFQQQQDSLIGNFDSLYRAKCLGAQRLETFYATYQLSEYHYTLYYYDQAGNLVKTLPPDGVQPNYSSSYFSSIRPGRITSI